LAQRVPWVLVRLRLGAIVALPWASTDLLTPPLETDPRVDEAAAALLSPIALRDLVHSALPPAAPEVKNISMHECFAIFLRVTEFAPPMSRRRVTNPREWRLPSLIPDRHQASYSCRCGSRYSSRNRPRAMSSRRSMTRCAILKRSNCAVARPSGLSGSIIAPATRK